MSSSISSGPSKPDPLKLFSQKLNELPGDTAKVLDIMENILAEKPQPELEKGLAARA